MFFFAPLGHDITWSEMKALKTPGPGWSWNCWSVQPFLLVHDHAMVVYLNVGLGFSKSHQIGIGIEGADIACCIFGLFRCLGLG